jgi:hypothetical protein
MVYYLSEDTVLFEKNLHLGGYILVAYEFQTALKDGIIQIPAEI